jgi:integrase/recombinase XerD
MTLLRQRMLEELQLRNYSPATIDSYISSVEEFANYFHIPPDLLGIEEVRQFHLHLIKDKKVAAQTVKVRISALRFFYWKTLKRRDIYFDDLPIPKTPKKLPVVLSHEEDLRLIKEAITVMHSTILILLYATGIRRAELRWLKVSDIDSQRMVIHIQEGKGRRDRDIPMTSTVLQVLRKYWLHATPAVYLFPSPCNTNEPEKPISAKTVWNVVHAAAVRAGLTKRIGPHTLRHSFATHHIEGGTDLPVLKSLLGHTELKSTLKYVHLSQRKMREAANPLDQLKLQSTEENLQP